VTISHNLGEPEYNKCKHITFGKVINATSNVGKYLFKEEIKHSENIRYTLNRLNTYDKTKENENTMRFKKGKYDQTSKRLKHVNLKQKACFYTLIKRYSSLNNRQLIYFEFLPFNHVD